LLMGEKTKTRAKEKTIRDRGDVKTQKKKTVGGGGKDRFEAAWKTPGHRRNKGG